MKKYTHAWLTFRAIRRLQESDIPAEDRGYTNGLITWLQEYKDSAIQGTWYPDYVIKDIAEAHNLKYTPSVEADNELRKLPTTYLSYQYRKKSPVYKSSFTVNEFHTLPDRCQALALTVIDLFKIQANENKGSPICPSNNQIAHMLFMLSHYVADAHDPFHCDSRQFIRGKNIHGHVEGKWDDEIQKYIMIDKSNERFHYDLEGYPLVNAERSYKYKSSFLYSVEESLKKRPFVPNFGFTNKTLGDFIEAICQYSYLLSYSFIPQGYDYSNITKRNWQSLGSISFHDLSVAVFADAIDSIALVFYRIWRRYARWYIHITDKHDDEQISRRSLHIPI